ncbi:MAG: ATP-binding cassette domain-containing protein [Alkalispirochaeta sp.]
MHIRGVRFSYGEPRPRQAAGSAGQAGQTLLEIPHLAIREGTISVLIGDNGSGKTTLLKLLAGLLAPSSGTIETASETVVLVHQRPYLFAESVRANVTWPLKIRRVRRDERRDRVDRALEQVGLTAFARRWAPSLSGGEKQRVAIARALVLQPGALLLDEPTSTIDAASVRAIETVLRRLADGGTTVVMSTHNEASAYRLADELISMAGGRLVPLRVNILHGSALDHGEEHIGRFRVTDGKEIYCPTATGDFTRAVVRMEDIILSTEEMTGSAQNHLFGTVRAVAAVGDELVRVDLDCGFSLSALVTQRSVEELCIAPGMQVCATFKASAVCLY